MQRAPKLTLCLPCSAKATEELKGQMALRTVRAVTVVRVGVDWTDGCFHRPYVPLTCQSWCELYFSVTTGSAGIWL